MINDDLLFIQKTVEEVTKYKLIRNTRQREYIVARTMYYGLAREFTKHSLSMIGKHLNKDHATVLHNLKNFDRDIIKDKNTSPDYLQCRSICEKVLGTEESNESSSKTERICILTAELARVNNENAFLKLELQQALRREDQNENRLLETFRELSFEDKMDLIFKARTILKVRKKLTA